MSLQNIRAATDESREELPQIIVTEEDGFDRASDDVIFDNSNYLNLTPVDPRKQFPVSVGNNSRHINPGDQSTPVQNSVNISAIQPANEGTASYGEEGYRRLTLSAEKPDNVIVAKP